jgi:hypothetical protein
VSRAMASDFANGNGRNRRDPDTETGQNAGRSGDGTEAAGVIGVQVFWRLARGAAVER